MTNAAANLALFLLDQTGSIHGRWQGRMSAKQQRELFGRFLGKGTVTINGDGETVVHTIKVCFGTDWDVTARLTFADLEFGR